MPIEDAQRQALLENQFALQDYHFRNFFPDTDRRIVTGGGAAIGRLYVLRGDAKWTLIDLSLLPEAAGQGIGGALVDGMLAEADAARRPVTLHVSITNRAKSLYLRKGFVDVRLEAADWIMERPAPAEEPEPDSALS